MIALPEQAETPNVQALASFTREEVTGLTTADVVLAREVSAGTECVWKNGTLVRPSTYAVSGKTITLGGALIAGDWVVVTYWARPGTY
jgi:hypothetical protein